MLMKNDFMSQFNEFHSMYGFHMTFHMLREKSHEMPRCLNDARALIFVPIPRAMLGDQDRVLVFRRKLIAGVELHAERGHVRTEVENRRRELRALMSHREFVIRRVALMAMRIAEMLAQL